MENIYKKIEEELNSLSEEERKEILNKLREEIDSIDKNLVSLISKRTLQSVMIGRVKRSLGMETYNPEREKQISQRIVKYIEEPLRDEALLRIYERILDESRAIQREELEKGNVFNIPINKMKISFKNLLSKKEFLLVATFFVTIVCIFYYTFFTSNYYSANAPVKFEVTKNEPLNKIADNLHEDGIIPSETNFKIAAFLSGAQRKIRAARYYIPNGLSYLGLVDYFLNSKPDLLKDVTIQSGTRLGWVAEKLKDDVLVDSSSIINTANNKNFLDSLGIKSNSMLGYILPQKYEIFERSTPKEILGKFYANFQNFMNDSLKQRAKKLGFTIHKVITLASIVEGETKKKSEMPKIAGVYYNRLKKGMKLQADPTIEFILKGGWQRLTYKDLNIKSPYNTYLHTGLPPGPINNPSKAAILAALYPDTKDNYLYFVADRNGEHKFSSTFKQHVRLADQYRQWLDSLRRK
jgi:peptidoglycan lytic transglycosylase G